MMFNKIASLLMTMVFISGCSNINASSFADSATTWVGLGSSNVVELNPLFSSFDRTSIAIGGAVLVKGIEYTYKRVLPKEQCIKKMHQFSSLKWGAAGNNLAIILGADNKASIVIGVISGLVAYNQPVNQLACEKSKFFEYFRKKA